MGVQPQATKVAKTHVIEHAISRTGSHLALHAPAILLHLSVHHQEPLVAGLDGTGLPSQQLWKLRQED